MQVTAAAASLRRHGVRVVKIDVGHEHNPSIRQRYNISIVPSFKYFVGHDFRRSRGDPGAQLRPCVRVCLRVCVRACGCVFAFVYAYACVRACKLRLCSPCVLARVAALVLCRPHLHSHWPAHPRALQPGTSDAGSVKISTTSCWLRSSSGTTRLPLLLPRRLHKTWQQAPQTPRTETTAEALSTTATSIATTVLLVRATARGETRFQTRRRWRRGARACAGASARRQLVWRTG
jgi:hypothetical protein